MSKKRTRHPKAVKFKAALAMIKNEKTVAELCQEFQTSSSVLHRWKGELLQKGPDLFDIKGPKIEAASQISELEKKIGQLTMEIDFLKKVSRSLQ